MDFEKTVTKILFVDQDETAFEFRKCMAKVIAALPPVELYHAKDATEALQILDTIQPNVIILDGECTEERELLLDSLYGNHPPVLIQTEENTHIKGLPKYSEEKNALVTCVDKNESIDGIQQMLLLASELGTKTVTKASAQIVH